MSSEKLTTLGTDTADPGAIGHTGARIRGGGVLMSKFGALGGKNGRCGRRVVGAVLASNSFQRFECLASEVKSIGLEKRRENM